MKFLRTTLLFLLLPAALNAQQVHGVVRGEAEDRPTPLPGVNVYWAGTNLGTTTDQYGHFSLLLPVDVEPKLVLSYVGFTGDTLLVKTPSVELDILLKSSVELKTVEVVERSAATKLDVRSVYNVQTLTEKELKKAACCDLSESFETNASVDVAFTDAVTGAKTIRMLGLDGKYTQILFENWPLIGGLSSTYGLGFVPGPWIQGINLTKGAGSVVNGYNSISGQLNIDLLKPDKAPRGYVNLYGNQNGRMEANAHFAQRMGEKWSTMLLLHGNYVERKNDHNKDGFLDMPTSERVSVMNRWRYFGDFFRTQFGVRFLYDDRVGGQTTFDPDGPRNTDIWGSQVRNEQQEAFWKGGLIFQRDQRKSIGFVLSGKRHVLNANFGERNYNGEQLSFYGNAVFQAELDSNDVHKIKAGGSLTLDQFQEQLVDSAFNRNETASGLFAEYTFTKGPIAVVLGLRGDLHNVLGFQLSPRVHFKYAPKPLTVLRLSAGKGFRSSSVVAENLSLLASSRRFLVQGDPRLEEALNFGVSFTHKFKWLDRKWLLAVDAYHTYFLEQVVVDRDRSPSEVHFFALDGTSQATSFQAEIGVELFRGLDLKVAYKKYISKTEYLDGPRYVPLIPSDRVLFNVGYITKKEHWMFDLTTNWFDGIRIPDTETNPEEYRMEGKAPSYATVNAQVTHVIKKRLDIYLGCENIFGYQQDPQIIAANDPFGPYFDASNIWGPVNGRVIYAGLRLTIDKK